MSLITWVVVALLVIVVVSGLLIPGLFTSCRVSNERTSTTSLKTLSTAESDFRANDRDWNHVNDFWTGDVKSFYTMTSSAAKGALGGTEDPPIKLIELSVAASDADGSLVEAGGENMSLSTFTVPSAKRGYWYAAMDFDRSSSSDSTYKVDTGGNPSMGSCHHLTKFGFVALPDSASAGPYAYIVNEGNTIYMTPMIRMGGPRSRDPLPAPPGLKWVPPELFSWPDDQTLKAWWSKNE
jgi:hypothetical protein